MSVNIDRLSKAHSFPRGEVDLVRPSRIRKFVKLRRSFSESVAC